MRTTRLALILSLLPAVSNAQTITSQAKVENLVSRSGHSGQRLECSVEPIRPTVGFSFRLQAGYIFHLPLGQFSGPGHRITVLTRITPEDQSPIFLSDSVRLPPIPQTERLLESGGGFFVGEGHYAVNWMVLDDSGRVCVKDWNIDAEVPHKLMIRQVMPRNTVAELSSRGTPPAGRQPKSGQTLRISVLLDAAPLSRGQFTERVLGAADQEFLLGTLSALLEELPASSVRLVVFNLEQQREIFRREAFDMASLNEVSQALNQLQLAKVDYQVIQSPTGHLKLLARLIKEEILAPEPSDAVIFLGPRERFHDKLTLEAKVKAARATPKFFFLVHGHPLNLPGYRSGQLGPPDGGGRRGTGVGLQPLQSPDMMAGPSSGNDSYDLSGAIRSSIPNSPAGLPDSVSMAVAKLKGKTIEVKTTLDFAKAIHLIEQHVVR